MKAVYHVWVHATPPNLTSVWTCATTYSTITVEMVAMVVKP